MKKLPLVTVCIPNYNYGHFIGDAIKSAADQTYENTEIIVADNASTDGSDRLISSLQSVYSFRYERNEKNIGIVPNFNKCLDLANGEFVVFLSSDDLLKPGFISSCLALFDDKSVGMVAAHCDGIDERNIITVKQPFFNSSGLISGPEHTRIFLMTGIYFPSQVLIRKSTLLDSGKWNLKFPIFFDWHLWFSISRRANVGYIKDGLVLYREHSGNASSASILNMQMIFEKYLLKLDFFGELEHDKSLARHLPKAIEKLSANSMYYAAMMLKSGKFALAEKYLNMALVFDADLRDSDEFRMLQFCLNLKSSDPLQTYTRLCDLYEDFESKRPFALPPNSVVI